MSVALFCCLFLLVVPWAGAQLASHAPCGCPEGLFGDCECVFEHQCGEDKTIIQDDQGPLPYREFTETCPEDETCCMVPNEFPDLDTPEVTDPPDSNEQGRETTSTTAKTVRKTTVTTKEPPTTTTTTTTTPTTTPPPPPPTTTTTTTTTTTAIPATTTVLPEEEEPIPFPRPNTDGGCGVRRTAESISQDSSTSFGEFPWMVAVLDLTSQTRASYQCGGTLLSHQVVLTSAHCVKSRQPKEVIVRAGDWDFASNREPLMPQDRRVSSIIIHPQFNDRTLINDVALLVLSKPLEPAHHLDTICLPEAGTYFTEQRCIVSSWGTQRTGRSDRGTVLHQVELSVLDHMECRAALRKAKLGKYFRLDKSFLCAAGKDNSACEADGGSPLMCQSSRDPQRYLQVGILAGGLGCGAKGTPTLFANMSLFSNWVFKEMEKRKLDNEAEHP